MRKESWLLQNLEMIRTEKYIQTRTCTQQFFNPPPADDEHVCHWLIPVAALLRRGRRENIKKESMHTLARWGENRKLIFCSVGRWRASPLLGPILLLWWLMFWRFGRFCFSKGPNLRPGALQQHSLHLPCLVCWLIQPGWHLSTPLPVYEIAINIT